MKNRQQGITLIGMLMTLATVVVMGILLMRVLPIYIENYEVKHAVRSLATLPASNFSMNTQANVQLLRTKLMNQLYISGIDAITPKNIQIKSKGVKQYDVTIAYIAKRVLVGNVSIVIDFKVNKEINVGSDEAR